MGPIESEYWDKLVRHHLPESETAPFAKKEQQGLANSLQKWTAHCIAYHLQEIVPEGKWKIEHQGKKFLGAMRNQEVDVWIWDERAGLILAADPKHFQSQDSFRKNWQNGLNDLVAFSTNMHERFPMCAVAGVIAFPEWAAVESDRKKIYNICQRSVSREKPLNAYGKFEAFTLVIYNRANELFWPFGKDSPLHPSQAFAHLASVIFERTLSLL